MSTITGAIYVNGGWTRLDRVGCCNRCGRFYIPLPGRNRTPKDPAICEGCGHYYIYRPDGIARDLTLAEKREYVWNNPKRDQGRANQEEIVKEIIG